ncbi:gag-asp_proteas domain-containing protein [Gossypium australe]|uniref:Gag-asp_proteas domain-containing protein n=1 Tax=Gossypium australe TaxID=47621 RepID=A0A5B6VNY6_9ROSI|nr:gag-asp_proteas domain-containing protein [Gossypium australe]
MDDESLYEAWEKLKELLCRCPHYGIPHCIQLETFYNGLNVQTRLVVDASANGVLLSKSYNEAYGIIDRIASKNCQWLTNRPYSGRRVARVHEVDALASLLAHVFSISSMLKQFTTNALNHVATQPPRQFDVVSYAYMAKNDALIQCQVATLKNLENKVGQLATELRPQGAFPSDMKNPRNFGKEHCKIVALRSGKTLEPKDVLKELHINIPLVEALEQMPNYVKFMKDIMSKKKRLSEFEIVALTKEWNAFLHNKLPLKMKDPRSFTIPYNIGESYCSKALCDLGENNFVEDPLENTLWSEPLEDKEGNESIALMKANLMDYVQLVRFEPLQLEAREYAQMKLSIEEPPKPELKVLPYHLKYVYLGNDSTFPMIISTELTEHQEKQLIEV